MVKAKFITLETMIRLIFLMSLLAAAVIPSDVFACGYPAYSSPTKTVKASELSQALIVWQDGTERLVIDPGLTGDAPDFGLAFAFPSKPEIKEAPRKMFDDIEEYTRPFEEPSFGYIGAMAGTGISFGVGARAPAVTVIETKKVGDFQATVLTATDSGALLEWLKRHRYQFTRADQENFDYYVTKGGYYFVALKIQITDSAAKKLKGEYELRPVEFTFQTAHPIFPLRLARDNDQKSKFRLYAISKKPLIVPGAGVAFSESLNHWGFLENFDIGDVRDSWLTKLDMWIDPSAIEHDLTLVQWEVPQEFRIDKRRYTYGSFDMKSDGTSEEQQPNLSYHPFPLIVESEKRDARAGIVAVTDINELNFPAKKISTIEVEQPFYTSWYRNPVLRNSMIFFGLLLLLYLYITLALSDLARRLNVRHRWRAWVPIVNLHLLVNLAGKRWWWFAGVLILPLIYFFLFFLTYQLAGVIEGASPEWQVTAQAQSVLVPFFLLLWLVEILLFIILFSRLAARCGRPAWWGPLMVLVPPVGLVLLGVMAWSKKKYV